MLIPGEITTLPKLVWCDKMVFYRQDDIVFVRKMKPNAGSMMAESDSIDILYDALYDEAIAKHRTGDTDAAIEMLRQLLAENPNYSLAHNALGALYSRQGKIDQAIEHTTRVCEIDPEDMFGYTILSTLCLKNGRREEAEEALMKANQLRHAAWLKLNAERKERSVEHKEQSAERKERSAEHKEQNAE